MTPRTGPGVELARSARPSRNLPPLEDPLTQPDAVPSACCHCGIGEREHMQRWTAGIGWHQWTPPTQDQIKTRLRQRAEKRTR